MNSNNSIKGRTVLITGGNRGLGREMALNLAKAGVRLCITASKDGKAYVLLGNLYLSEDKIQLAVDSIKKGLKKGKVENISQVHLTLGQAYFELQKFDDAKKEFRIAARDKDKKVKTTANNWLKYTENEEIRVKNLALRREYIQSQS